MIYFLIMAVLMTTAGAQQQPATASLSGVVVGVATGTPAADVRVSLARIQKSLPVGIAALMKFNGISADVPSEEKRIPFESLQQSRNGFPSRVTQSPEELEILEIVLNPTGSVALVTGRAPPQNTGADGRFSFENLDPGEYQLFFSGRGYGERSFGQRYAGGSGEPIVLSAGQTRNDVLMQLPAAAIIEGRVLTNEGRPVVGVPVRLFRLAYDEWGHRLDYNDWGKKSRSDPDVARVETNDRGEYRIYSPPPGRYLLLAFPNWLRSLPGDDSDGIDSSRFDEPFATTYYPGGANVEAAEAIELKPGAELRRVDLILTRAPLRRIRGRVTGAETEQTPAHLRGRVLLEQSVDFSAFRVRYSRINPDGTFEFPDVLSGSYHLVSPTEDRAVVTVADADLDGVLFPPLNNGVSVHVSIPRSGSPGRPGTASQTFQIKVELGLINERLTRSFSGSWPMMKAAEPGGVPVILSVNDWSGWREEPTVVTESGGLTWPLAMYPGSYKVSITELPSAFYVKEVRFGRDDVLNGPLRLTGSDPNPLLEIVISANGGSLEGVAVDGRGRPVPRAHVVLVPEQTSHRADLFKSAFADLDGRFILIGIPPGDYKLVAWEALERYGFFAPERLKQASDTGQLVHIAESSRQTLNVIPIPTDQ